jgi:signal transduction histidine kinase
VKAASAGIRPDYTPHARAERLIAAGRFVLALSSLVAVYLEPSTPARFQQVTYALLAFYTLYALVTVAVSWRLPVPSARARLISHAVDLGLFSTFVYFTEGPASPFFLYFVFSLFCATLRFSRRGIVATGVVAVSIYGGMAVVAWISDPQFEISRVLIRETYLAVIATLLVYLGMFHERLRSETASLAAWPREIAGEIDEALQASLSHAAAVMNAPRVMLLWEESEEPWTWVAVIENGAFRIDRLPPGSHIPPADGAAAHASCYVREPGVPLLVYDPVRSTTFEVFGARLATSIRARYAVTTAIVVSLESSGLAIQFVIPEPRAATGDELALAHIAGRFLLATIEQSKYVQQVRHAASAEERMRISRELHDGIVQSLGGVGLQLQALRRDFPVNPDAVERLAYVQRVVEHDQRELRALVRELRPLDGRSGAEIIRDELVRVQERYALEWGLEVEVDTREDCDVPPRLAHEVCRIVNESLANAARHGGATRASVGVTRTDGSVRLCVSDNGCGFPFTGDYDLEALDRAGVGPRTLKERVSLLEGTLVVRSSPRGAAIFATLPVPEETAR